MDMAGEEEPEGVVTPQSPAPSFTISLPFSTMTIEQLLEALPKCSPSDVSEAWLPAMRIKCEGLKALLQASIDKKEPFNREFTEAEKLASFIYDLHDITTAYTNTLKSAEVLAQHDLTDLVDGVRIYERKYRQQQAKVEAADKLTRAKEESINDLKITLREIVRVLGTFIETNIHGPLPPEVRQIIAEYGATADDWPPPHVRISEATLNNMLSKHDDTRVHLEQFRALTVGQDDLIKSQNDLMVKHAQKYEACLRALKAKDDEIFALRDRYATLQAKLTKRENARQRSGSKTAIRGEENLRKYVANLEVQIDALAGGVANRDTQIESLLSQLRKRCVGLRKPRPAQIGMQTGVQAGAQTAMQARAQDVSSICSQPPGEGGQEAGQRQGGSEYGVMPKRSNSTVAAVGPRGKTPRASSSATASTPRPLAHHRRSAPASSSVYSQEGDQKNAPAPTDKLNLFPRPRSDSLGALRKLGKTLASGGERHHHKQLCSDARQLSSQSSSGARKILGDIPEAEASAEQGGSPQAPSISSSDREVYRRSISALNALNMADNASITALLGNLAADEDSGGFIPRQAEPHTSSLMYHQATRHFSK